MESLDEFRRQVVSCSLLLEEEVRSISDALPVVSGNGTRISDLTPLARKLLTQLHILATRVSDLSPLQGMLLQDFSASDDLIRAHHDFLSAIPNLDTINNKPAAEVLAQQ